MGGEDKQTLFQKIFDQNPLFEYFGKRAWTKDHPLAEDSWYTPRGKFTHFDKEKKDPHMHPEGYSQLEVDRHSM